MRGFACLLALCALTLGAAPVLGATTPERTLEVPRFGKVTVYGASRRPASVALFLSGDGGWHFGVVDMARALANTGALVVGVDVRHYLAELKQTNGHCASLAGDFEKLSHRVQKELALESYTVPVLIGYSSGATVVYATLAQAPAGTFAGGLSLGFCPDQDFGGASLCPATNLKYSPDKHGAYVFEPARQLQTPWTALQGQKDQVCSAPAVDSFAAEITEASVVRLPLVGHGFSVERNWMPQFREAYLKAAEHARPPAVRSPEIGDLPLIELPAHGAQGHARFALLFSGDGGWAGLDRAVAAKLSASGLGVVGFDTLRYYWSEHSPEQSAQDVARVLRHYFDDWRSSKVMLIGYSFGADVLPFIVNRLPRDLRDRVASVSLISPSRDASFEVHVADWLPGFKSAGVPTQPEIERMPAVPILCLYGNGDTTALCPALQGNRVQSEQLGTGHHLGGDYDALAVRILATGASSSGIT